MVMKDDDTVKIGALIKEKRQQKGLTMKRLADMVEVSEGTISRWESGDIQNIKRSKIEKLSNILDISIYTIMGWKNPDDGENSDIAKQINDLLPSLDETEQKLVLSYIRGIYDTKKL